jgi:ribosomal protein S18 acetylase RimI-like enzyme
MHIEVTDNPSPDDERFVVAQVRAFNLPFAEWDFKSLCVFARNNEGSIIGGLVGHTYWQYLYVGFLWVHEAHRKSGLGSKLMFEAESQAKSRGCKRAFLDTFSFQAFDFYRRLGYLEFGRLPGFSGKYDRLCMHKALDEEGV